MTYRIHVFLADRKLADLACDKPIPDVRADAVEAIALLNADYALIVDLQGRQMDRLKRSA
jgi:hypothetical protein